MKYIQKAAAPRAFTDWRARVRGTDKEKFGELPAAEKAVLINALMGEQGGLCAYTMRHSEETSSHIEHIKPQTVCRAEQPGNDLDYQNLVACFPREGMKSQYRYGAQARGYWWNPPLFVTPLQPNCEARFRFNLYGEVAALDGDAAAAETLKRLALDHKSLTEDRRRVIEDFIYSEPLTVTAAQRWIAQVAQRKKDGQFIEFCIAIRHALEDYLKNLEKHRRKRAFAMRIR